MLKQMYKAATRNGVDFGWGVSLCGAEVSGRSFRIHWLYMGLYALRVIATSTEHERKAYNPKTTFVEPKRKAIHPPKH
ncbi:hypothetical protein DNHGIG_37190 [Collibacillus ludicampi]|uniref:Uncharacterized protein n=1 Tax=Collibacillus ludicampi TaxID=2771369 RepID=A0AAV4LJY1_9BACL|nr:hypothetical protein DNHGIG_37190 [Collibacillus ludicampi]